MADEASGVHGWLEHASLRLRIMVGLGLVIGGLAIGYVAGITSKPDLSAARAAGQRAGAAEARARGTQQGYAVGLASGTRDGAKQTFRPSYRTAYRRALLQAGGG